MDNILANDRIEVVLKQDEKQTEVQEEITLAELIRVFLKGKWLIGAFAVAALAVTLFYIKFLSPEIGKIETIISFNYEGIEKGLDPNGQNMDVSMIKAPVVLDQVVRALQLDQYNITSDDLRKNISISPVIPGNVTEHIKRLEEDIKGNIDALQEYVYFPNKYIITFSVDRDLGISEKFAQQIVDEVVKQYQQYFYRTYSDMSVLANAIQPIEYDEYDYPEISTIIHNQLDIFMNFLNTKLKQTNGENFRSVETGLSFSDIRESISIIQHVDLGRLDSMIGAYNLTKNKEKLIKLYEYKIKMEELNMKNKNEEASLLTDIIQKYQKDKKLILTAAMGVEGAGLLNLEDTDEYYNVLTQKYVDAGVAANQSRINIQYYQQEIDKLQNDMVDAESKAAAEEDVKYYISLIKGRIEYWIDVTNKTVEEYYETNLFNQAITRNSPSQFTSNFSENIMFLLFAAMVGLLLGACVVFIRYYQKKYEPIKISLK